MARRPWLSRNLMVLSLVSLTQDAASELMYPLMPLFLVGVLAAPPIVLGVVEGAAELAAGISKYLAGRASDRVGRRVFISTGYGLAAVGKVVVAASTVWPTVLVGRVVDRVGKGVRSAPRDAMITVATDPADYSRALGFHRSADTFGAVLGPLIALAGLALLDGDVRAVMWWAVVPAALSVALTFLVREPPRTLRPDTEPPHAEMVNLPLPRSFWSTATPLIVIALTNVPDTLLLLRLSQLGASTTSVVWAYIAFNVVYTVAAYPAGVLSSRLAPSTVYTIGLVAFGVTYGTLGLLREAGPAAYLAVAAYGLFPALTDGVGKAMVAAATPKHSHGKAQGTYQSLVGAAILGAGTWAGLTWGMGAGSGSVPFTIAGVGALIGAGWMATRARRDGQARLS